MGQQRNRGIKLKSQIDRLTRGVVNTLMMVYRQLTYQIKDIAQVQVMRRHFLKLQQDKTYFIPFKCKEFALDINNWTEKLWEVQEKRGYFLTPRKVI